MEERSRKIQEGRSRKKDPGRKIQEGRKEGRKEGTFLGEVVIGAREAEEVVQDGTYHPPLC